MDFQEYRDDNLENNENIINIINNIDYSNVSNRHEYIIFNNTDYRILNDNSMDVINHEIYKNFCSDHLITKFIIQTTKLGITQRFILYITNQPLEKEYILMNNSLYDTRPVIYESGTCRYNNKTYNYFITDIIVNKVHKDLTKTFEFLLNMKECLEKFYLINYCCGDIKLNNIISGKINNSIFDENNFINMNEFSPANNTFINQRNVYNTIFTEITNNININENIITTLLMQLSLINFYKSECGEIEFFNQNCIFDIKGKYYLRDEAASQFKPNQGYSTRYDLLNKNYVYIGDMRGILRAIDNFVNNDNNYNLIRNNYNHFNNYYNFSLAARPLNLTMPENVYKWILEHINVFNDDFSAFQQIRKPKYVSNYVNTHEIFNNIKNNIWLFDSFNVFRNVAPNNLINLINNEDDYINMTTIDLKVFDYIRDNYDHILDTYNIYNNDAFDKIDKFNYLRHIGFKNCFINTILCIFNKANNYRQVTCEEIHDYFNDFVHRFNDQLGNFNDYYFANFAIAIIYFITAREGTHNYLTDMNILNKLIENILLLVRNNVYANYSIANEMNKRWCMNGGYINIVDCNNTNVIEGRKVNDLTDKERNYLWINFNDYMNYMTQNTRRRYRGDFSAIN